MHLVLIINANRGGQGKTPMVAPRSKNDHPDGTGTDRI
jgi:hypothetical protein